MNANWAEALFPLSGTAMLLGAQQLGTWAMMTQEVIIKCLAVGSQHSHYTLQQQKGSTQVQPSYKEPWQGSLGD